MANDFKNLTDLGGLRTDAPEDKIPDRNATDIANIDLSSVGFIQTARGYDPFGNQLTASGENLRGYLYKKNFGELIRIKLRVRDNGTTSILEWFNPENPDNDDGKWEPLVTGLTTGAVMGFTPFNNTNVNQLVFCNGVNNYSTWNGATSYLASVTSNTITKSGTSTFAYEGFTSTGSVIIDGTEYAYTGGTGTTTLTGVTPDPTTQNPAAGSGIAQKPDTTTYTTQPKGNVLLTAMARVWVANVKDRESTLYYTAVGSSTNFTSGTNPADGGIEDFPDGAGGIKLLDAKNNNQVIIHKEDALLSFSLDYTATAKIAKLNVLAFADDIGASNLKSGTGLNQISYFTTKTEGLKSLQRAIEGAELNLDSITDVILPTIADYDFTETAAIYYPPKRVIYVACKSSSDESANDKVIAYYIRKGVGGNYIGDISIDDLFVADWIVEEKNLYYVSSINQNTYKMFTRKSANQVGIKHKWVSKSLTFNEPARGKEFNKLYVEGFIGSNTKIKITILYGILGADGTASKTIEWNNDDYVYGQKISALGTDVLGTLSLGSRSADILDSYPFSVPIHFDVNKSTRYKIKIETLYDDETSAESYWAISNIATNPNLKTIENNKTLNSNS